MKPNYTIRMETKRAEQKNVREKIRAQACTNFSRRRATYDVYDVVRTIKRFDVYALCVRVRFVVRNWSTFRVLLA